MSRSASGAAGLAAAFGRGIMKSEGEPSDEQRRSDGGAAARRCGAPGSRWRLPGAQPCPAGVVSIRVGMPGGGQGACRRSGEALRALWAPGSRLAALYGANESRSDAGKVLERPVRRSAERHLPAVCDSSRAADAAALARCWLELSCSLRSSVSVAVLCRIHPSETQPTLSAAPALLPRRRNTPHSLASSPLDAPSPAQPAMADEQQQMHEGGGAPFREGDFGAKPLHPAAADSPSRQADFHGLPVDSPQRPATTASRAAAHEEEMGGDKGGGTTAGDRAARGRLPAECCCKRPRFQHSSCNPPLQSWEGSRPSAPPP